MVWFRVTLYGPWMMKKCVKICCYPLANEVAKGYSNATVCPSHPCEHSRINILQWILTKLGTSLGESGTLLIFKVKGRCHRVKFLPHNILVNTRINILQWILTKLGTCIVLRRVEPYWFSRSKVKGSNFHRIISLWTLESTTFNGFWPNLVHT